MQIIHSIIPISLSAILLLTACNTPANQNTQQEQPANNVQKMPELANNTAKNTIVETQITQDNPSVQNQQAVAPKNAALPDADTELAPQNAIAPSEIAIADEATENQEIPTEQAKTKENDVFHSIEALPPEYLQKLENITWDVDPEILNAVEQKNEGGHFPFSDEKHLDLFKEHIENLGGTYIGVGTDQGYLFIGWQRPTLAFVIDYDPWVVIIHRIYMTFWKQCNSSECLYQYFYEREKGMEFLKGEIGTSAELNKPLPLKVYKSTQKSIAKQLKRLERMNVKTFMNDPESFQYIKTMIQNGRIRTLQANLLGDRAFASIASTLNELGAKVTTLYLSNAEQYWGYSTQFKKNIIGIPAADNALILRTSATYPNNNDYRYSIQPVSVFKAWLQHPDGKTVRQVTKRVKVQNPEDFPFVIDDFLPPQAEEPSK